MRCKRAILTLCFGPLFLDGWSHSVYGGNLEKIAGHELPVVTPAPTVALEQDIDMFINREGMNKHRDFLVQHYPEQGLPYEPGEFEKEEDLSPAERERRYGPQVECHKELPGLYY